MELDDLLEKVNSKETFLAFLEALMFDKLDEDKKELQNPTDDFSDGHNTWVNGSIAQYLESIHAFGETNDDIQLNWQSIALLFYAGKFYE
jgi:hypothetical protein